MIANLVSNPMEPNDYLGCPTSIWFRKIIWKDISWLHEMFTEYGYTERTFSTKAGVYVWWMDPAWLVMKDPTFGCPDQSFETFQSLRGRWQLPGGSSGFRCAPCQLVVWWKAFLLTTGHWKTFLVWSPWDFLFLTQFMQFLIVHVILLPNILTGCLLRCL